MKQTSEYDAVLVPSPRVVVQPEATASVAEWLRTSVAEARALTIEFARRRADEHFTTPDTAVLATALTDFVSRGKFLRSSFAHVGWLCGRPESAGAVQAAASLELLHAFALIQDDVMDESVTRRGRPTIHTLLTDWADELGVVADPGRFGRSAAVLLSDLCLIWSERMLREAGLPGDALARVWPVFDLLRAELAVGQFQDLLNEDVAGVAQETVLAVARRKSGNYTVLRPLQFGAALADCRPDVVRALSRYGVAVGEAFQLRDDLLGVFGDPATTGKPVGDDLLQRKATSVVVAARDLADAGQLRRLTKLHENRPKSGQDVWVREWQDLIRETGADEWIEQAIDSRVTDALGALDTASDLPPRAHDALTLLSTECTRRRL